MYAESAASDPLVGEWGVGNFSSFFRSIAKGMFSIYIALIHIVWSEKRCEKLFTPHLPASQSPDPLRCGRVAFLARFVGLAGRSLAVLVSNKAGATWQISSYM